MHFRKTVFSLFLGFLFFSVSSVNAKPQFWDIALQLKGEAETAHFHTDKIERLSKTVDRLASNVDNAADQIWSKKQKVKISDLEDKVDSFQRKVNELDRELSLLKALAASMQTKSNKIKSMVSAPARVNVNQKCPPGKRWVKGHYNRRGVWVAPQCK